jgi:hypothetical protein
LSGETATLNNWFGPEHDYEKLLIFYAIIISMDNLDFLFTEDSINNYNNSIPFKFKQKVPLTVSWDDAFTLVDQEIRDNLKTNHRWYGNYDGTGFKIRKADKLEQIASVVDKLFFMFGHSDEKKYARPSQAQQMYLCFTTDESVNNPPHIDKDHVFFWQLQGKCSWEIYDKSGENVEYTFHLEPGDIIYCPPFLKHQVITISARVGASIGFDSFKA